MKDVQGSVYNSLLEELKHKKQKVEFILKHFPEARNNDNTLCVIYWKLVDKVETVHDIQYATKAEVLRRARQKIQNEQGRFKPTRKDVQLKRRINEKKIRIHINQI